jgi:putative transposase
VGAQAEVRAVAEDQVRVGVARPPCLGGRESGGLTEAVRIVACVAREVRVSVGGVCGLGYLVVGCRKCRRPVQAGRAVGRSGELIRAKTSGYGWRIVALEIVPDHVHLFGTAHRSEPPSRIASQFQGFIGRRLRTQLPHRRCCLTSRQYRPYVAATADAVFSQTVCRYTGMQNERRWRKESAR